MLSPEVEWSCYVCTRQPRQLSGSVVGLKQFQKLALEQHTMWANIHTVAVLVTLGRSLGLQTLLVAFSLTALE